MREQAETLLEKLISLSILGVPILLLLILAIIAHINANKIIARNKERGEGTWDWMETYPHEVAMSIGYFATGLYVLFFIAVLLFNLPINKA